MAISAERWRERMRQSGEAFRWFPAALCGCSDPRTCSLCGRDGRIYAEKVLPAGAKAWFGTTDTDSRDSEMGVVLPTGSTQFTCMPDECSPQRLDLILAVDQEEAVREMVARGAGDDDEFAHGYVVSVQSVRQGATVYHEGVDFTRLAKGIRWSGSHRPNGRYAAEYRYQPMYYFLSRISLPFRDDAGAFMPLDGVLTEKPAAKG